MNSIRAAQVAELLRARGLVWSMLDRLGRFDPGSNPGGPTTSFFVHETSNAGDDRLCVDPREPQSK